MIFPGAIGGTNCGGTASDPKLGYVFTFTNEYGSIGWIEKKPDGSVVPYDQASVEGSPFNSKFWARKTDASGRVLGASSWPCQKPPWGRLTAVNVKTGEFAWQVPLGVTDELPEGKRNTGRIGFGGPIVTTLQLSSSSTARPTTNASAPSTPAPAKCCGKPSSNTARFPCP